MAASKVLPTVAGIAIVSELIYEIDSGTVHEAIDMMFVTIAVFVVLAVLGLITALVLRIHSESNRVRTPRALPAAWRAEVLATDPANRAESHTERMSGRTPLALPAASADRSQAL